MGRDYSSVLIRKLRYKNKHLCWLFCVNTEKLWKFRHWNWWVFLIVQSVHACMCVGEGGGEAVIDKILEIKNFIVHSGSLLLNLVNYWMRKLQNDKQKHFKKKIYTYVEKWHIFFAYNLVTDYQRSFVPSVMFVNKKPVCTVAVLAAAQSSFFGVFFKNALCHFILHN